jgi:hypothetical protein
MKAAGMFACRKGAFCKTETAPCSHGRCFQARPPAGGDGACALWPLSTKGGLGVTLCGTGPGRPNCSGNCSAQQKLLFLVTSRMLFVNSSLLPNVIFFFY